MAEYASLFRATSYKGFGSFGGDEATHNFGGGDASGNAAFAPKLPTKPAST
jgi:hypothetical protein